MCIDSLGQVQMLLEETETKSRGTEPGTWALLQTASLWSFYFECYFHRLIHELVDLHILKRSSKQWQS